MARRLAIALLFVLLSGLAFFAIRVPFPGATRLSIAGAQRTGIIHRGETVRLPLRLTSGQYVRIGVWQWEIDLNVTIQSHDAPVAPINASDYGPEEFSFIAPNSGEYEVLISAPPRTTNRGQYSLRVLELRPAVASDRGDVEAQHLFVEAASLSSGSKADLERAIRLLGQATELWRAGGSEVRRAHALMLLGRLQARTGFYTSAMAGFKAATDLYAARREEACRLVAIRNLRRASYTLPLVGVPTEEEMLPLWKSLQDRRGIAEALSASAGHALRARDFSRSLDLEKQGLALRTLIGDREGRIRSMEGIYTLEMHRKHYDAAMQLAREILALREEEGNARDIAAAESSLAVVCDAAGRHPEAIRHYRRVLEAHQLHGDLSAEASAHHALGGALELAGDEDAAFREYRRDLQLKRQIIERFDSPSARAQFGAYGGALADFVGTVARSSRGVPPEQKVESAFEEVDGFFALCVGWRNGRDSSMAAIRAALDEDTVLLGYESGAGGSWLWTVTRDSLEFHTLPPERELKALIEAADPLIAAAPAAGRMDPTGQTRALEALSRALLAPARSQLHRRRILVMGDSLIQRIPFAILHDPLAAPATPLLNAHEIAFLPTAGPFIASRKPLNTAPLTAQSVTIVADPYSGSKAAPADLQRAAEAAGPFPLPRLPFARAEALDIARMAPPGASRLLFDHSANRSIFSGADLSSSRVIHFATHAIVNAADAELSGLVLSDRGEGNRPMDPFVRLRDLNDLRLGADLVVLSGCRTARGAEPFGMVTVSLATSFLRAGASRVIATAWKVDDEATAAFMSYFYKAYFKGTPAIAALREAQLTMASSARWRHPFYWAGFLLYGDWR